MSCNKLKSLIRGSVNSTHLEILHHGMQKNKNDILLHLNPALKQKRKKKKNK